MVFCIDEDLETVEMWTQDLEIFNQFLSLRPKYEKIPNRAKLKTEKTYEDLEVTYEDLEMRMKKAEDLEIYPTAPHF